MLTEILPLFPLTTTCDSSGALSIANQRLSDLAAAYGTPLYLFDAATLRQRLQDLRAALAAAYPGPSAVTYAAKAYFSLGLARRLAALGVGLDVVSRGELGMAQKAGFDPHKLHLHGNNKSAAELQTALALGLQAIVVDSLDELAFLESQAAQARRPARLWLRLTPGITGDTHAYGQTGQAATKFGLPLEDGQAAEALRLARCSEWLQPVGLHMHLGSGLHEPAPYAEAVRRLLAWARQQDFCPQEFSPGGGWYVRYTPEDPQLPLAEWTQAIGRAVQAECAAAAWPLPNLVLEPGRWIVAQAGVALYRVGACKLSGEGTRWAAVDGGIADNPRPALYQSRYTALLDGRAHEPPADPVNIVGKFCQSGDFLIHGARLPAPRRGDLLVMPVVGAYQLSQASNYNLADRPAVLWLEDGRAEVLQAREDLLQSSWWLN
jgi:diaminopimelate decarboxylase